MAVQTTYPGVYIEEFTPGAPIQGVGTSTAAFIGAARKGPIRVPTKITSWDSFRSQFGDQPVAGTFLWYAVQGFFQNRGQVCYIVRASFGAYGVLTINTTTGAMALFDIQTREPGPGIDAATTKTHLLDKTKTQLYQPTGALVGAVTAGDTQFVMGNASAQNFKPGDVVTIGGATPEDAQIVRITPGTTNSVVLVAGPLANNHGGGAGVRLADTLSGATTFRIQYTGVLPANALVPGALLTIAQGANTDSEYVASVFQEQISGGNVTYRVTLREGLGFAVDMTTAATVQSEEFTLSVKKGPTTTDYKGLALDPRHPRYYLSTINDDPDVQVQLLPKEPPPTVPVPGRMPEDKVLTALAGGQAEDYTKIGDLQYTQALDTLAPIDDVNMIAVPDSQQPGVQQPVIDQCQLLADRFAVLDCRPGLDPLASTGVLAQRAQVTSPRGYAALYYPWIRVAEANGGLPLLVPPSGHICGILARSDNSRGVHKAPANEIVSGALGVERVLSDIDQGQLNPQGVNVIRVFQAGGRPVLFGARTTASDRNWQYINVRRLFEYLEESIQEGIQWAVFEPNNKSLWKKLERSIGDFLNKTWRDGALFGAKAEEAYYVRIDDALNPFSEQALGRLHIEIGVRPSYPAEFIIVRIGIWPGGSDISEV